MKPLIAIDIDDVIFPFNQEIIRSFNDRYGVSMDHAEIHVHADYMYPHFKDFDHQDVIEGFVRNHSIDVEPIAGSVDAMTALSEDYRIVIMTARPKASRNVSERWLQRYFDGLFEELYLLGNKYEGGYQTPITKGEKCVEIGASFLIDDFPKYILSAHEKGVNVILFGDYDWNKDLHTELPHATEWVQVKGLIDGITL